MKSWRDDNFKKQFLRLPSDVQDLADATYELWKTSPNHPSLHFKHLDNDIWSVRIGRSYRALGVKRADDDILWFWIGSHTDYDKLYNKTKTLKKGQKMKRQKKKQ